MIGSMASACATSSPLVSSPSACPSSKKTTTAARFRRRRTVSCRATGSSGRGDNNYSLLWLPRRDVMLNGLSGLAAGLSWYPGLVDGAECTRADKVNENTVQCTDTDPGVSPCPLVSATAAVVDFTPERKVTRVRQPVHLLSTEYQAKYKEAVGKMKALPESNPLSFKAQAAIHQAYCDSYYKYHRSSSSSGSAAKDDDPVFDVHYSWIFAPWHRMYIYFYEKALGDLIGDDTFALPFWNWDHPAGMVVPPLFTEGGSTASNPLYDANRNPANLDALIDLDYLHDKDKDPIPFKGPKDQEYNKLVNKNLSTVYTQQVRNKGAESFLGEKYCTDLGSSTSSMGSLERMVHTAVHVWVGKSGPTPETATCTAATGGVPNHSKGDGAYSCQNDMGFLGSAGNDPLFYSHHSNVDRLWHLWSTRLGGGQGFTDPDWLDTSFVFYDDVKNPRKVRIRFRDVLDTRDLGYTYDPESDRDLPWLRPKITTLVPHGEDSGAAATSAVAAPVFPLALSKGQVVEVPAVAVPAMEAGKEQLLVIDGIEFDPHANNKFDVAINVPTDKALQVGPQYKEYAGSFAAVPGSGAGGTRQGKVSLCITDVLYDIDAENDSTVDIVIVPRTAAKVTLNVRPTIKNRN